MNEDVPAISCHFTKLEECHIKRDYHFKLPSAFKLFQSIKKNIYVSVSSGMLFAPIRSQH